MHCVRRIWIGTAVNMWIYIKTDGCTDTYTFVFVPDTQPWSTPSPSCGPCQRLLTEAAHQLRRDASVLKFCSRQHQPCSPNQQLHTCSSHKSPHNNERLWDRSNHHCVLTSPCRLEIRTSRNEESGQFFVQLENHRKDPMLICKESRPHARPAG